MRRSDHQYPVSPPGNYGTPSHRRREFSSSRPTPLVYQVYGSMPESGSNGYPGVFSPVRTNRPFNNVSPPTSAVAPRQSNEDNLYASFSPPRRPMPSRQSRVIPSGKTSSIFRPKELSVIVARESSSHDDSSITYGSKRVASPSGTYAAATHQQPKEISPISKSNSSFPSKLHEILSSAEYQDLITWLPHGRAFRVLKPKVFEEKIIPKYFRSSKYASFMRQVNGWGFRRITTPGPDFNAYWHELFLRGLPDLCTKMKRPQKNDPDFNKNEDPPDFYRVDKFSPLPGRPVQSQRHVAAVAHSSSMSSVSCEATPKEQHRHFQSTPSVAANSGEGHTSCAGVGSSWDRFERTTSEEVAVNLSDVYESEENPDSRLISPNELSQADLQYLIQQNRALIQQARMQEARGGYKDE